jgi:ribose transport system permease protein
VGAVAALTGILLAKLLALNIPGGVVILVCLLFGLGVGLVVNGLLIGCLRLSFFVVTLASMIAISGVVSLWANTQSFFVTAPAILAIGSQDWIGIPIAVWIMIGIFVIALYVQERTFFGRDVYAVGGSIIAARLSGVRTSRTVVAVYAISGMCAALAGIFGVGRIGAASPTPDNTVALQAAAAVLLGGTSLLGGSGGVGGTALGVLFIGVLQNGLSIAGVQSFWQEVVTGVILVAAVLGDRLVAGGGIASFMQRRRGRKPNSSEDRRES